MFSCAGTLLSLQVLDLLHTMVKFGLYQNKDKVTKLVDPLVDLLNGAMDREEVPEDRSGLGVGSVAIPAALLRGSSGRRINRYKKVSSPSVDTALVIESKKLVLRILRLLSNAQLDLEVVGLARYTRREVFRFTASLKSRAVAILYGRLQLTGPMDSLTTGQHLFQ
jgi:hypothetical protein